MLEAGSFRLEEVRGRHAKQCPLVLFDSAKRNGQGEAEAFL
jgi:hypothetical protein